MVRGSAAPSTTATVGTLNAQFATDRLSMTLDSVADGFDEMLTMRHQLYRQFATRDQMVQIAGPEGVQSVNVPISRIRGNYRKTQTLWLVRFGSLKICCYNKRSNTIDNDESRCSIRF